MAESAPRPLHLHTLDSLLADLVSGRGVSFGDGAIFTLPDDRARSALQWYRKRDAANWPANVSAAHGEELVDAIKLAPPEVRALPARLANANKRRLRLVRLQAHRFAGLHKFGTPAAAPPDYVCDFSAPLTLFEGRNGSGKTSLANAILWGLTGEILRPQRVPAGLSELRTLAIAGNWKAQFWLARHYQSRPGRLNQLRAVVWFDRSFNCGNRAAKVAKLAQLRKITPLKSKFIFMAMGITETVALIWRATLNEQELRLYEPLMFHLKRRNNQSA